MGHTATKPDKVNISITKDFRDRKLTNWGIICFIVKVVTH